MSEAQFMLILQRQREREEQMRSRQEEQEISRPQETNVPTEYQHGGMDVDQPLNTVPAESNYENNSIPLGMFPPTVSSKDARPEVSETYSSIKSEEKQKQKKLTRKSKYGMYEDIEEMMFGFGDDWPPAADTVELVEDLAVKYIKDLCQRAVQVAGYTGKLDKQCFMYAVRKDTRKFTRAYALLKANEELRAARTTTIAEEEKLATDALPSKSSSYASAFLRTDPDAAHSSATLPVAEVGTANSASLAVGEEGGQSGRGGRGGGRGGRGSKAGRGEGSGRGRGRGGGDLGKVPHETQSEGDGTGGGGSGRGGGRGGRGRGSEKGEGGRGRGRGRGRGAAADVAPSENPPEQQADASLPDNMLAV